MNYVDVGNWSVDLSERPFKELERISSISTTSILIFKGKPEKFKIVWMCALWQFNHKLKIQTSNFLAVTVVSRI